MSVDPAFKSVNRNTAGFYIWRIEVRRNLQNLKIIFVLINAQGEGSGVLQFTKPKNDALDKFWANTYIKQTLATFFSPHKKVWGV